jgi:hypothetical protein
MQGRVGHLPHDPLLDDRLAGWAGADLPAQEQGAPSIIKLLVRQHDRVVQTRGLREAGRVVGDLFRAEGEDRRCLAAVQPVVGDPLARRDQPDCQGLVAGTQQRIDARALRAGLLRDALLLFGIEALALVLAFLALIRGARGPGLVLVGLWRGLLASLRPVLGGVVLILAHGTARRLFQFSSAVLLDEPGPADNGKATTSSIE